MATEHERIREARRAFARGRARLALGAVLASAALMLLAWTFGNQGKTFWVGLVLMGVSAMSLYLGRAAGRAVLPAFVVGLIPFSALLIVQGMSGHACSVAGCTSLCLPTCVTSGLVAGGLIAFVSLRVRETASFVGAAATMTWLVGALGCPCVGMSSLVGMAIGISLPSLAVLPLALRSRVGSG